MTKERCELTIGSEVILGIVIIRRPDYIEAVPLTSNMGSGDFPDEIEFDGGYRSRMPNIYDDMKDVLSIDTIPALPGSLFFWGACTKHNSCKKVAYYFPGKESYSRGELKEMFRERYCECEKCEFNKERE